MLDIGWQTETLLNNCSWLAYTKTKRNCSHWEFFLYSVFFNHYLTQDNSFQFTQIHLNPTPIPSSKRTLNTITLSKKNLSAYLNECLFSWNCISSISPNKFVLWFILSEWNTACFDFFNYMLKLLFVLPPMYFNVKNIFVFLENLRILNML